MFPQSKYYGPQVWYSNNDNSKFFANILQKNLIKDLHWDSNRQEKLALDEYKILSCEKHIPSVIVECGFLSNTSDEAKLKTESYQDKIAQSILNSVIEYYENNALIKN